MRSFACFACSSPVQRCGRILRGATMLTRAVVPTVYKLFQPCEILLKVPI